MSEQQGSDRATAASGEWARCLDDLSQHLQQQRAALIAGDLGTIAPFRPPRLPPLPPALAGTANLLLQESRLLEADLRAAHDHVRRQLRMVRRLEQRTSSPVHFEQHA